MQKDALKIAIKGLLGHWAYLALRIRVARVRTCIK